MQIPRIFHPDLLATDSKVTLTPDATNHVANVLRLKEEHPIVLFNGDGNEYSAHIALAKKREVVAMVDAKLSLSVESPLPIHLGQGISKGDRMDLVIQKSVELGVQEITPIITERCVVKLSPERWQKKQQQWQKIIVGACEQSGRNSLPKLNDVVTLNDWVKQSTSELRLTLDPKSEQRMSQLPYSHQGIRLMIGPEGGFSDREVYISKEAGYASVSMGPRILRTETAALTSIAILQSQFGDI
ncbi:16S rRNA (uracil(1498)-N(3))-methyltransferase [Alteromonadaceae bacterium M269]|nr:16S rRNA (uracil(1498)-N(3))-methyltransferase [Alteromonadaceae bacterium M269]